MSAERRISRISLNPSGERRSRRSLPRARDNEPSSFAPILADLVARVPGGIGAVLVDVDGEAVDYTGALDTFDLKLAGAHWQIVLGEVRRAFASAPPGVGTARTLIVRGASRSFVARALPDDYALVLLLSRRAGFAYAARAFSVCERALAQEAGWPLPNRGAWFPHDVMATRAGRPARLLDGPREIPLEILGQLAKSRTETRSRGWRVRLANGAELTLVCEPGNRWYGDEPLEALASRPGA